MAPPADSGPTAPAAVDAAPAPVAALEEKDAVSPAADAPATAATGEVVPAGETASSGVEAGGDGGMSVGALKEALPATAEGAGVEAGAEATAAAAEGAGSAGAEVEVRIFRFRRLPVAVASKTFAPCLCCVFTPRSGALALALWYRSIVRVLQSRQGAFCFFVACRASSRKWKCRGARRHLQFSRCCHTQRV